MRHSPSSLKLYDTCPRKFYRERVVRDVRPEMGEAARKGIEQHKLFELAVSESRYDDLPAPYGEYVRCVDAAYPVKRLEHRLALDQDLKKCAWEDAWIRGIADAVWWHPKSRRALIVDWKTGARRPWPLQLKLYAFYILAASPEVAEVTVMFEWLRFYQRDVQRYTQEHRPALARELVKAAETIEADTTWLPKPSGLCKKYCEVPDCEYRT